MITREAVKTIILRTPNWILGPVILIFWCIMLFAIIFGIIFIDSYVGGLVGLGQGGVLFFCLLTGFIIVAGYNIGIPVARSFKDWIDSK